MEDLLKFYLDKDEPNKSCLLSLRQLILKSFAALKETRKYGMPCFCIENKPLFYLWVDRKTQCPYILFVDGGKLQYDVLEQGKRAKMKVLSVNPHEDLPVGLINDILAEAIAIYKRGN